MEQSKNKNKGKNLSQRFILETYSPLHIGSGEELKENIDFIREENGFFIVDIQKTLQSLQEENQGLNNYYKTAQLRDLLEVSENKYGYNLLYQKSNFNNDSKSFIKQQKNASDRLESVKE